jgi:hypothetical protein
LPGYRDRLVVLPGVTGLAQVQLPPDTDVESVRRKLACDLYYIRHSSLWLDLRIIIGTAIGALGLPLSLTRSLLRLPSVKVHEVDSGDLSGEGDLSPQGVEPVSRATIGWHRLPGSDGAERPDCLAAEIGVAPRGLEPLSQVNPA